jgi:hypothetical protein
MNKYKELFYEGKTYTEKHDIEEILVKEDMAWFINTETELVRLEIQNNTLIFNSGKFYNGTWIFGAFRSGTIKYIDWKDGVFFNGIWENGIFNDGIIFNGKFYSGTFLKGKIRLTDQKGLPTKHDFIDCDLSDNMKTIK